MKLFRFCREGDLFRSEICVALKIDSHIFLGESQSRKLHIAGARPGP